VYQIGKLLDSVSSGIKMPRQFLQVVMRMLQKSVTAEQALQMLLALPK
jgi:hypothetical protein